MDRVLIAGAGNFGREIASWIDGCRGYGTAWKLAGFLNDDLHALDGFAEPPERILGTIADYRPQPDERIVLAIGDPKGKLQVAERLQQRGAQFLQLIHQSAVVCRNVRLGAGVLIAPFAFVGGAADVGDFATVSVGSIVAHDVVLGAGCTLTGHCSLAGHVRLGKGVFMGTHACVIPQITVGDWAMLGAGSTIVRDVAAGSHVFGVPAKRIPELGGSASHESASQSGAVGGNENNTTSSS